MGGAASPGGTARDCYRQTHPALSHPARCPSQRLHLPPHSARPSACPPPHQPHARCSGGGAGCPLAEGHFTSAGNVHGGQQPVPSGLACANWHPCFRVCLCLCVGECVCTSVCPCACTHVLPGPRVDVGSRPMSPHLSPPHGTGHHHPLYRGGVGVPGRCPACSPALLSLATG